MRINYLLNRVNLFYKLASSSLIEQYLPGANELIYALVAYKLLESTNKESSSYKERLAIYAKQLCRNSAMAGEGSNAAEILRRADLIATQYVNNFISNLSSKDKAELFKQLVNEKLKNVLIPTRIRVQESLDLGDSGGGDLAENQLAEEESEEVEIAPARRLRI